MDILSYILGKKAGGGGGEAVLINKNVDANGTYNASADSADGYKKVVVSVPNTYAAGDEGKVVSNGALVAQGSASYTANGTYDTTLVNEVEVDVPSEVDYLKKKADGTLTTYSNPSITSIVSGAFFGCGNLVSLFLPNLTSIAGQVNFSECGLVKFALPSFVGNLTASLFQKCNNLEKLDLSSSNLSGNMAFNCGKLNTLILRKTAVVSMANTGALGGTPFKSGGSGGDIYIPKSLYDHLGDGTANDYKAATNWSTYDDYGTITWHAIEGSYYATHYADDTPIS